MISSNNKHFIVIYHDESEIFRSERAGIIAGLTMARLAHGSDLLGSTVSISHLGITSARLCSHFSIANVKALNVSPAAISYLVEKNISLDYSVIAEDIDSSLDKLSSSYVETEKLFECLQLALLSFASWFRLPSDDEIAATPSLRIGTGGGGT